MHPPIELIEAWRPILDLVAAAHAGEVDLAADRLQALLDRGDARAAIPLAEIRAFRGEWMDCLDTAGMALENPSSALSLFIFPEMAQLAALAGERTGQWLRLDVRLHRSREVLEEWQDSAGRNHWLAMLERIAAWSEREGGPPDPAINPAPLYPSHPDGENPDEGLRRERLARRIHNTTRLRPQLMADPRYRAQTELFWAIAFRLPEEAFRIASEQPGVVGFAEAVYLATVLAAAGDIEGAWGRIEQALPRWQPQDRAQVAPVALLFEPGLTEVMTPERCGWVVRRSGIAAR